MATTFPARLASAACSIAASSGVAAEISVRRVCKKFLEGQPAGVCGSDPPRTLPQGLPRALRWAFRRRAGFVNHGGHGDA